MFGFNLDRLQHIFDRIVSSYVEAPLFEAFKVLLDEGDPGVKGVRAHHFVRIFCAETHI